MIDIYSDSREQKPLDFKEPYVETVSKCTLPYGDYACKIKGTRVPTVFERKSLPDLFGTLGRGMTRFKKEINRASDDNTRLIIIIEKPLATIFKGHKRSKIQGIQIVRTLFTLQTKHNVPFVCCKNRDEMSIYIQEYYYSWVKLMT